MTNYFCENNGSNINTLYTTSKRITEKHFNIVTNILKDFGAEGLEHTLFNTHTIQDEEAIINVNNTNISQWNLLMAKAISEYPGYGSTKTKLKNTNNRNIRDMLKKGVYMGTHMPAILNLKTDDGLWINKRFIVFRTCESAIVGSKKTSKINQLYHCNSACKGSYWKPQPKCSFKGPSDLAGNTPIIQDDCFVQKSQPYAYNLCEIIRQISAMKIILDNNTSSDLARYIYDPVSQKPFTAEELLNFQTKYMEIISDIESSWKKHTALAPGSSDLLSSGTKIILVGTVIGLIPGVAEISALTNIVYLLSSLGVAQIIQSKVSPLELAWQKGSSTDIAKETLKLLLQTGITYTENVPGRMIVGNVIGNLKHFSEATINNPLLDLAGLTIIKTPFVVNNLLPNVAVNYAPLLVSGQGVSILKSNSHENMWDLDVNNAIYTQQSLNKKSFILNSDNLSNDVYVNKSITLLKTFKKISKTVLAASKWKHKTFASAAGGGLSNYFNYITNPSNNKQVHINSSLGTKILNKYIIHTS